MPGLLDYLFSGGRGGLLPPPQPGQEPFGSGYVNSDSSGLLGAFRQALNQVADPTALAQAYEQQAGQRAGMALLNALPTQQGTLPQAPAAAAPALGLPQNTNVPRGIRNNNPLNIEAGPFTQGQPGFLGSDGRFAQFAQPQQGIDAAGKLLDTYQSKYGLNTVRGIVNRWAPSGEAGNNTSGYVASVASRLGVDPDQPLSPEQRQPLIMAMGQFENGRPIGNAAPSQAMGFNGIPLRPDAQGAYGSDAVMLPQQGQPAPFQVAQAGNGPLPMPSPGVPLSMPQQAAAAPAAPPQSQAAPPQRTPGTPAMAGSGLTLLDSPAIQGMPDSVRKALPIMLASKQYAPQAMAMIQKYINPEQWQRMRDAQGNVITRNTATNEMKPLTSATPDMMNAAASGVATPLDYTARQEQNKVTAQNTALTEAEKNARASSMTPLQFDTRKTQEAKLAEQYAKRYETLTNAGNESLQEIPKLQAAQNVIVNSPNFYSGPLQEYNLQLKKIGASLGITDPRLAQDQEYVSKTLAGNVLSGLRSNFGGQGLGPVRVVEFQQLVGSLANMSNSRPALATLNELAIRTHTRNAAIAEMAQNYNNGSGVLDPGFDRAVADYDKSHPILSAEEVANIKKIVAMPSDAKTATANPYEAEMRRRGFIQ